MIKLHKTKEYVEYRNREIYKTQGLIGSIFFSNRCGRFKVLRINNKTKSGEKKYDIQFLSTNEVYNVTKNHIISGSISDCMYPTVYGVGCIGKDNDELNRCDKKLHDALYNRWNHMISRVYCKTSTSYKWYGGRGITISDELLNFSNYCKVVMNLPGFDRDKLINGELEIDKDEKQKSIPIGERIYSADTLTLLSHKNNCKYIDQFAISDINSIDFAYLNTNASDDYVWRYESNIIKFAKNHNMFDTVIHNVLRHKGKTHRGYIFRYLTHDELAKVKSGEIKPGDIIERITKQQVELLAGDGRNTKYFCYKSPNDSYYILYKNINKFSREYNINSKVISSVLNNVPYGDTKGFQFRFPTDEEIMLIKSGLLNIGDKLI